MKPMILAATALASTLVFAQQPPAASPPPGTKPPQSAPNPAEFDKQLAQVQSNIQKMQEQMARLGQTKDPQERKRLLQEHWTTMQAAMAAMHGLGGCCGGAGAGASGPMMGGQMMGGMMGWRGASNYYSNLTPEQLRQRQYMTDQTLAMQQQMMSQMMLHHQWMNQIPPSQK